MVRTTTQNPAIQKGIDAVYALNADTVLREQIASVIKLSVIMKTKWQLQGRKARQKAEKKVAQKVFLTLSSVL